MGKVHKIDEMILYKITIDKLFTGIGSFERSDVKYTKIVYILYYVLYSIKYCTKEADKINDFLSIITTVFYRLFFAVLGGLMGEKVVTIIGSSFGCRYIAQKSCFFTVLCVFHNHIEKL